MLERSGLVGARCPVGQGGRTAARWAGNSQLSSFRGPPPPSADRLEDSQAWEFVHSFDQQNRCHKPAPTVPYALHGRAVRDPCDREVTNRNIRLKPGHTESRADAT